MRPEILKKTISQLFKDQPNRAELTVQLHEFIQSRKAADLAKITQDEYQATVGGLQALISHLKKISKTLNQQDAARKSIEQEAELLNQLMGAIVNSYKGLRQINV